MKSIEKTGDIKDLYTFMDATSPHIIRIVKPVAKRSCRGRLSQTTEL
ncbi:MAG: hypothetical protein ACLT02_12455 [Prevotella sp.]